jgi:hypothetical protein
VTTFAYTPEQITAFWSGVAAIATVAAAAVAIVTLLALKSDSRDRARPVISAELLPLALTHGTCEFAIKNVGVGVAKSISVTFTPPITEDMGQLAGFLARRYGREIPTMGPGRRLTNIYGHWVGDGSHRFDEAVPQEFVVRVAYRDTHGRRYDDEYQLSAMTLRNETTSSPADTDDAGLKRRWANALEVIARAIDRL